MTRITAGTFSAKIAAMPNQATVEYRIIAYDNFNNSAVSDNQGLLYRYSVIPEFPSGIIIAVLIGPTCLPLHSLKDAKSRSEFCFSRGEVVFNHLSVHKRQHRGKSV